MSKSERPSQGHQPPPALIDIPVGIDARGTRRETDSLGAVEVPADRYWGAQTQRALRHFAIGEDRMPLAVYHAYGLIKKAAAMVNARGGRLPLWMAELIGRVCDEIIAGALDDHFPLLLWQAGSGTQTNMNVNEVVANRCIRLVGGELGSKDPVHPNDHVNMSQSSNDTFPTATHIAAYELTGKHTLPAVRRLRDALAQRATQWGDVVKIGRTHLQDAVPLTVGQEWSGFVGALDQALDEAEHAVAGLLRLPIGGTAVGTGLNAPAGFDRQVVAALAQLTGDDYTVTPSKFTAQSTLGDLLRAHTALKGLAVALFKIANDIRWLGSGPSAGLGELRLPANEPGSSIMPGKVNPTQCEAMLMVCMRVIGADTTLSLAGAESNFQLNTCRPLAIGEYVHSASTLGDACDSLRRFLVEGVELDGERLQDNVRHAVMMVTALAPAIGYDAAAKIAQYATATGSDLKASALANGVDPDLYDRLVDPLDMTRPDLPA